MKATLSDLFDFRINYKDVTFLVNQDIAREEIPHFIVVILIATWTWTPQVENAHHRNSIAISLGHCFCCTLLSLKATYIWLANSRLRFMYCAKSLEFIGDSCDSAIFRILRIVASLWNWLRNIIVHIDTWFLLQRYNNFLNMQGIGVQISYSQTGISYKWHPQKNGG